MSDAATPRLAKSLGPVGVMLLTFSALSPVVSFYVAGDTVLHMAGTGAGLAYIVGAVGSALLALLFAEIGAAFPGAGGIYPSIRAILGPITSFPYIILLALRRSPSPEPPIRRWVSPTMSPCSPLRPRRF